MNAKLMDGKALAGKIYDRLTQEVLSLKAQGIEPGLAVILAGDDPASQVYVRNKARACERVGVMSRVIRLPGDVSQESLLELIEQINQDPSIHGLLVQLPLPKHIDETAVLRAIAPEKDVDGFHAMNAGALLNGTDGMLPCTPHGVVELLKEAQVPLKAAHAVVIGRSNIVGKPAAILLLREDCTVTVCHSKTKNLSEITKQADILVCAIGKAKFVTADMVKPGAAVIDVGMNRDEAGKLCGDVDYEAVAQVAGAITPVPGGVGPMTIAMLIDNTVKAARK